MSDPGGKRLLGTFPRFQIRLQRQHLAPVRRQRGRQFMDVTGTIDK